MDVVGLLFVGTGCLLIGVFVGAVGHNYLLRTDPAFKIALAIIPRADAMVMLLEQRERSRNRRATKTVADPVEDAPYVTGGPLPPGDPMT